MRIRLPESPLPAVLAVAVVRSVFVIFHLLVIPCQLQSVLCTAMSPGHHELALVAIQQCLRNLDGHSFARSSMAVRVTHSARAVQHVKANIITAAANTATSAAKGSDRIMFGIRDWREDDTARPQVRQRAAIVGEKMTRATTKKKLSLH